MKKIFSTCFVAAFVLVASLSCDRKVSDPAPYTSQVNVSSEEDFLHFKTESDYDSALVNPKLSIKAPAGFISLSSVRAQAPNAKTNANGKERELPQQLTRLLNKDGVMQVGNWVIKLNFEDKLVRVIANDQKKKLYSKLIKEQQDKDIYVFSFEDEVFALLDEGITSSPTLANASNGRVNGLCFGGGISEQEGRISQNAHSTCTNQPPISYTPNTADYLRGTSYNKYGVYFELNAYIHAYVTPQYSNVFDPCLINGDFTANIYWRSNCNGNTGVWPSNPSQTYIYNLTYIYQAGSQLYFAQEWGVYSGSRGIRCLQVSDFSMTTQNAPWIGGSSNFSGVCP